MANYTPIEDMLEGAQPLDALQKVAPTPAPASLMDRIAPVMEEIPYGPNERLPLHIAGRWILAAIVGTWAILISIVWASYKAVEFFFPNAF